MSRGNRQQAVFRTDMDREMFLAALGEACGRTGWKVHAYVLMGNHYHLLLETAEPNLVAGMQWLQSTYTKRFNAYHREWGHLFQGRYKAIPVEPGEGYLITYGIFRTFRSGSSQTRNGFACNNNHNQERELPWARR